MNVENSGLAGNTVGYQAPWAAHFCSDRFGGVSKFHVVSVKEINREGTVVGLCRGWSGGA